MFVFPFQSNYASQDLGTESTNINPTDTLENKKPKKERLRSLDTFRGYVLSFHYNRALVMLINFTKACLTIFFCYCG